MNRDYPDDPRIVFNSAEAAHAWRVAAWCAEIARRQGLSDISAEALERAAILHQRSKLVVNEEAWQGLCEALGLEVSVDRAEEDDAERLALSLLRVLQGDRSASRELKELAWIVERCDNLDNACEMDARVGSDPELTSLNDTVAALRKYLMAVGKSELDHAALKIPVFPAVAEKAIGLLGSDETNVKELQNLIASDQTLAGHIVAAANTANVAGRRRVATLGEAITRIGFTRSRDVVFACALRRMFGVRHSHTLWNHSLEVAETARELAQQGGRTDPDEAFLAGLMHDIGKLVVLSLPRGTTESYDRLARKGCPDVIVERVIFGSGHPAIGAGLLQRWKFNDRIASAVRYHHEPEQDGSVLSAVVYLAERAARRDEDLESGWRDELARRVSGFSGPLELIRTDSVLSGLRFDS